MKLTPDLRDTNHTLGPGERHTIRIAGKAYHWQRFLYGGNLTLVPGHAHGDPEACRYTEHHHPYRTCALHRGHTTQHLHKPDLATPGVLWGPLPSINVTLDADGHLVIDPASKAALTKAWGR